MSEGDYVRVVNNCKEAVVVRLHRRRPKKGPPIGLASFRLEPGQETQPVPRQWLVGASGWEELRNRDCVVIQSVEYQPRYVQVLNASEEAIQLVLRIRRPSAEPRVRKLTLKPRQRSRVVDLKVIRDRKRLDALVSSKKLAIYPAVSIGPATGRGEALGSYYGEDVYTCYRCGRPIVFRGSPPTPVHV